MRRSALAALPALALALSACGGTGGGEAMEVAIVGADGAELGTVGLSETDGLVAAEIDLQGLAPGFHGFHIHETAECDADAADGPFTSAGGHYAGDGGDHGDHAGDLPPLLVPASGEVQATVSTDAFTLAELTEGDGSAVMVHEGPDNSANIPDRYTSSEAQQPGPDEETLSTGDAGGRFGCGVVTAEDGEGS